MTELKAIGGMTVSVPGLLDRLARVREDRNQNREDINGQIAAVERQIREVVPDLVSKIDEIRATGEKLDAQLAEEDKALANAIGDSTVSLGETQRGKTLMAVYSKPRVAWDNKGLDGYAVAHPEIEVFKKVGKASVAIRKIK